jgi:hypothetical protein
MVSCVVSYATSVVEATVQPPIQGHSVSAGWREVMSPDALFIRFARFG